MYQPYFSKILLIRTGFSFAYIQQQQGHRCSTSDGAANAQAVAVAAATNRARLVAGRGFGHAVRAVGTELGRRLPAQERRPGAQGELQRIGKPLGLAGRPGRRRKTDPISSSGGAVAEAARRRRSNGGHCRPGSLRREAGGGVGHAVKGGRVVARQATASAGTTARRERTPTYWQAARFSFALHIFNSLIHLQCYHLYYQPIHINMVFQKQQFPLFLAQPLSHFPSPAVFFQQLQ